MKHEGQFKKGSKVGRPKGAPNKVTLELKTMIRNALDKVGGEEYLATQAALNPNSFMTLLGKTIPSDIKATLDANHKLTIQVVKFGDMKSE